MPGDKHTGLRIYVSFSTSVLFRSVRQFFQDYYPNSCYTDSLYQYGRVLSQPGKLKLRVPKCFYAETLDVYSRLIIDNEKQFLEGLMEETPAHVLRLVPLKT